MPSSVARFQSVLAAGISVAVFVVLLVLARATDRSRPKAEDSQLRRVWPGRDWSMGGGSPSRNLVNFHDRNIPSFWDVRPGHGKNIRWIAELGTKCYGAPVIDRGKIFIGTNNDKPRDPTVKGDKGILMCFRESDGQFLWQAVHDKLATGRINDWPHLGIVSMPAVEDHRLYYVSNRGEVVCADTEGMANGNQGVQDESYKGNKNADIIWRLDMMDQLGVFPHNLAVCSPLIVGDRLFLVTANGVDEDHINIPRPDAPSFLAIDKKNGKVLWKDNAPSQALVEARKAGGKVNIRRLVNEGKLLMHGQWSNPVYAEPNGKPMIIFPGGDGWIRAYSPDKGELLWKFDCNPKGSKYVLGPRATRSHFIATPVVWENKLYIGVGQDPEHKKGVGHLWCIDITKTPRNKDKDLSPVNNNFDPRVAVNKDSGLVWHYGGKAPRGVRRNYQFGRTLSTCAVHDGLCYAADYDGYIYCLDANTGEKYWEDKLGADTWSSPYWVDGKVYIGCENGAVLIYRHGKAKKLVNRIDMGVEAIRSTLIVANGVLYVCTDQPTRLYAISIH